MGDAGILSYIRVSPAQAKFLEFLADRAGETSWDWSKCRPDVTTMVTDLVDKRLLYDLRAEGKLRLSDQGRSAVSQIREAIQRAPRIVST